MPKLPAKELPENLKPFAFHGLDLDWAPNVKETITTCPFCQQEGKFSINSETGLWQCWWGACERKGNPATFLQQLYRESFEATEHTEYNPFAEERGLDPLTLIEWGFAKSITTNSWLLPGYNLERTLSNLYVWKPQQKAFWGTSTMNHTLIGLNLFDFDKPFVYLHEGYWDTAAWWEKLRQYKRGDDDKLHRTSNIDLSLYSMTNVLGVPGIKVFYESWCSLFAGKTVYLGYDNDHPQKNPRTGQLSKPAAFEAMKRVGKILANSPVPPDEIWYANWGGEHEGYDPNLPHGFDCRDWLNRDHTAFELD